MPMTTMVASMDWPQVTKYKALVSAQPHRQEIIDLLSSTTSDERRGVVHSGLIRELLISSKKSTCHKPHRLIFNRDGVSEVLLNEMDKIRRACASLEEGALLKKCCREAELKMREEVQVQHHTLVGKVLMTCKTHVVSCKQNVTQNNGSKKVKWSKGDEHETEENLQSPPFVAVNESMQSPHLELAIASISTNISRLP
ncbi:hypothetical protein L2E82_15882 [Cichorium intybus]|uniref:Uncharacterized protein n=1 Tax=Cichorium intybus TaxID=13427 RepID=A0ACB9F578_CICIN|nr:hypothetical protein L2E82_15882 [Cichorium intybus]